MLKKQENKVFLDKETLDMMKKHKDKVFLDKDLEYLVSSNGLKVFIKDDYADPLTREGYFRDSKGFLNVHDSDTRYYSDDITDETIMVTIFGALTHGFEKRQSLDVMEKLDIINFYRNVNKHVSENWVENKDVSFKVEKGSQSINF